MANIAGPIPEEQLRDLAALQRPAFLYPDEQQLEVKVLFTGEAQTKAALQSAAHLAGRLNARLSLLVLHVVPRPLPPDCPAVSMEFLAQRLRELAASVEAEVQVQVYLCRDKRQALRRVFRTPALVVIGNKKRWWPSKERRLGNVLEGLGHTVLYVER